MIDEVGVRDEGGLTGEEEGWEGGSGQHNFGSFTGFRIRQSAEIKMTISNEDRKKRDTRRSGTEQRKSLGVMSVKDGWFRVQAFRAFAFI